MRVQTKGGISRWIKPVDMGYASLDSIVEVGKNLATDMPDTLVVYGHIGYKVRFFYGNPEIDSMGHADTLQEGIILKAINSTPIDEIVARINDGIREGPLFKFNGQRTLQEFSSGEYAEAAKPWKAGGGREVRPDLEGVKLYRMK